MKPTEEQLERVRKIANAKLRPDGREYTNSVHFDPTDREALRAVLAHRKVLVEEVARLTEERDRLRDALEFYEHEYLIKSNRKMLKSALMIAVLHRLLILPSHRPARV